jgi:hypothetical protein
MNPWDVVTWIAAVVLAVSGVGIFGFFLRDARAVLTHDFHDDEPESTGDEADPGS